MKKLSLPSVVCVVLDPLLGLKVKHVYCKIPHAFGHLWTLSWGVPTPEAPVHACIPHSINLVRLEEKSLALSYRMELFILIAALQSGKRRQSLCKSLLSERTSSHFCKVSPRKATITAIERFNSDSFFSRSTVAPFGHLLSQYSFLACSKLQIPISSVSFAPGNSISLWE